MSTDRHQIDPKLATRPRIAPSPRVGIAVVASYIVVVAGLQLATGIDYSDWFTTAENIYKAAVFPLCVGAIISVAFLFWARWDMIWRDPNRLPMSKFLWVPPILFSAAIIPRLIAIDWNAIAGELLVAVVLTSILVGFAEEVLFRGIFLRSMRTRGRPEAWCALWTAAAFGLFHIPNIFMGQGLFGIGQVLLAMLSGFTLYLFRRGFGLLVVAMVFHGLWDFSVFLDGDHGEGLLHDLSLPIILTVSIASVTALAMVLRRDRTLVVTPAGATQLAGT